MTRTMSKRTFTLDVTVEGNFKKADADGFSVVEDLKSLIEEEITVWNGDDEFTVTGVIEK